MNDHIQKLLDYCYADELKDFMGQFNLDTFHIAHEFNPFQKNHIFYQLHMMLLALEADKKHEVRRVLVLSTAHLTSTTMKSAEYQPNFTSEHEYGAYFYVGAAGDVTPFEDPEDYPSDLYNCLLYARINNCDEVKFDRDGPVVEGLRTYDW